MTLEAEVTLCQFGQGVFSVDDRLDAFTQLDSEQQRSQFVDLYLYVWGLELTEADVEKTLADCPLATTDPLYDYLRLYRIESELDFGVVIPQSDSPPGGRLNEAYRVLLYLFRAVYQRLYALEKTTPTHWWYQDFTGIDVAERMLTRHRTLVDEAYHDPGYRSEFKALARLWYKRIILPMYRTANEDPTNESDRFLSYDEILTDSMEWATNIDDCNLRILRTSLEKAFRRCHSLSRDLANRLVLDVLDKYMLDLYDRSIFERPTGL